MLDAGALASDRDSMNKSKMLKMIGVVGTPRESEIAYKVHPDYWGKGYMSEALEMFLDLFWKLEGNIEAHHQTFEPCAKPMVRKQHGE